jgi:hypothetical protein
MADEIVKGVNDFTLCRQERVFAVETGWAIQKTYEGPRSMSESFCANLINQGASKITDSLGSAVSVVTAQFPLTPSGYNEDQRARDEAIWELIPEPTEKLLAAHPAFTAGAAYIPEIDTAISTGDPAKYKPTPDWDTKYAGGGGKLEEYRDLRVGGTDAYTSGVWRVRMTMTVSRVSLITASYAKVFSIVTWADIGVPSSAKFKQPYLWQWTGAAFVYSALADWLDMGFSITWRKGIRKWDITQEWVGSVKASGTIYAGGTATP